MKNLSFFTDGGDNQLARHSIRQASVIIGIDDETGAKFLVYGRRYLKQACLKSDPSEVHPLFIRFIFPIELSKLLNIVKRIKGVTDFRKKDIFVTEWLTRIPTPANTPAEVPDKIITGLSDEEWDQLEAHDFAAPNAPPSCPPLFRS